MKASHHAQHKRELKFCNQTRPHTHLLLRCEKRRGLPSATTNSTDWHEWHAYALFLEKGDDALQDDERAFTLRSW